MLINVDEQSGTVSKIEVGKSDITLQACDRLHEELAGWIEYHKLAGRQADTADRYTAIAGQEFQHSLVALMDLLHSILARATPQEMEEFKRFQSECFEK